MFQEVTAKWPAAVDVLGVNRLGGRHDRVVVPRVDDVSRGLLFRREPGDTETVGVGDRASAVGEGQLQVPRAVPVRAVVGVLDRLAEQQADLGGVAGNRLHIRDRSDRRPGGVVELCASIGGGVVEHLNVVAGRRGPSRDAHCIRGVRIE